MRNIYNMVFIVIFLMILWVPFLLAHREDCRISDMENRMLASVPHIMKENGDINFSYSADFDAWINDNVRFRTILMELNSALQYRLFGRIAKESLREGKEGHLYYVDEDKVREYQHVNLLSEEELTAYITSMQKLNDYLKERGIAFYYMQCYDKDSIYPEYYVKGVKQFGDMSRANQIVDALKRNTDVSVIPIYKELMDHKGEELLYFKVSDPAHWNEYGAHIGYETLLNTIKNDFPMVYSLKDSDYLITRYQDKTEIYGYTYPYPENSLRYKIKEPKAKELILDEFDPEKVIRYREYGHYYVNQECENDLKIMVVGDSYIRQFLKEHIAESFRETLSIDWINLTNLDKVLEIYEPDIVIFESAEFTLNYTIPLVNEISYSE